MQYYYLINEFSKYNDVGGKRYFDSSDTGLFRALHFHISIIGIFLYFIPVGSSGVLCFLGDMNEMYGILLALSFVLMVAMTAVMVRIPPISRIPESYAGRAPEKKRDRERVKISESSPSGCGEIKGIYGNGIPRPAPPEPAGPSAPPEHTGSPFPHARPIRRLPHRSYPGL